MKHFCYTLGLLLATFLLAACEINIDDTGGKDPNDPYTPQPDPTDRSYGFGEPVEIHNENFDVTFQYKEGTIVIKSQDYQWIDHVEADTIVYFKAGMPAEIRPQVGFPLVLELPEHGWEEILEKVPSGLRNMVLEVSEVDGLLRCVTTMAPLSDIYEVFELEGVFNPLENLHSMTLLDGVEVPLERIEPNEFANFGHGEEMLIGEDIPWDSVEEVRPFSVPRFGARKNAAENVDGFTKWPDGSFVRFHGSPFRARIYLPQDIMLAQARILLAELDKHKDLLLLPDDIKKQIVFLNCFEGGMYFYLSLLYYSKISLQQGREYHYLQPGIGVALEGKIDGSTSDFEGVLPEGNKIKEFFQSFQKIPILPDPGIPLIPFPVGETPIVLYLDVHPKIDAKVKLAGSIDLSADLGEVSVPIRTNGDWEKPVFSSPKLKDLEIDGTIGLHILPSFEIGLGIGSEVVVPTTYSYLCIHPDLGLDMELEFFFKDDIKNKSYEWSLDPSLILCSKLGLQLKVKEKIPSFSVVLNGGTEELQTVASTDELEIPLLRKKFNILPKPSQLRKNRISSDPLTFSFDYIMSPGLLLTIYRLYRPARLAEGLLSLWGKELSAGIQVRNIDLKPSKVVDNYYNEDGYSFLSPSFQVHTEVCSGLEKNVQYRARPVMRLWGMNLVYSTLYVPFSSNEGNKKVSHISGRVRMEYDEQGRPILLEDLFEGGISRFSYDSDGTISFRYEEGEDYFQSERVETNDQGFITRISGHYNDGEAQDIQCKYSADGHLTYVNNVFSEGDSYTSTYKWEDGLLRRVEWTSEEAAFAYDEDDEDEDEDEDNGYMTYLYGSTENKQVQYTVSLCEDHNLGCLLMSGLFGLPPTHLPESMGFPKWLSYLPPELHELSNFLSMAYINYRTDSDGYLCDEIITGSWEGRDYELSRFHYSYTTDSNSAPGVRNQVAPGTRRLHRSPFRSRRQRR